LYETQIIIEYLDERFPHPPLMQAIPVSRANNRLCRYRIQRDLYSHVEVLQRGCNKRKAATARRKMRENLTALAPICCQYLRLNCPGKQNLCSLTPTVYSIARLFKAV